jgi:hypothetical protein
VDDIFQAAQWMLLQLMGYLSQRFFIILLVFVVGFVHN